MSRVEKAQKVELERESSHKVEIIHEDDIPVLDVPSAAAEGDKTLGDGTEGEVNDEKPEGDKTEEGDKVKEDLKNKEKKLWMEYADFCKCFRLEHFAKFLVLINSLMISKVNVSSIFTFHCNSS